MKALQPVIYSRKWRAKRRAPDRHAPPPTIVAGRKIVFSRNAEYKTRPRGAAKRSSVRLPRDHDPLSAA